MPRRSHLRLSGQAEAFQVSIRKSAAEWNPDSEDEADGDKSAGND